MASERSAAHPLNSRELPSSREPSAAAVAVKVMSTPPSPSPPPPPPWPPLPPGA